MRKPHSTIKKSRLFRDIPLFSCLEENEIAALESVARQRAFPKDAIIINDGDETDSLYVVLKGSCAAISIYPNGKHLVLNIFKPGDYFGELSFIDGEPRCASVITKAPSAFLIIRRKDFRKLVSDNPDLAFNFMKGLTKKIRTATKQIEDLAFRDVYGRIARLFNELKNRDGIINERLTVQEIAFRVGSSREMASRIITELKNGMYITKNRNFIKINKELPYKF